MCYGVLIMTNLDTHRLSRLRSKGFDKSSALQELSWFPSLQPMERFTGHTRGRPATMSTPQHQSLSRRIKSLYPLAMTKVRLWYRCGFFVSPDDDRAATDKIRENRGAVRIKEIWKNRKMKNQFASSVLHENYLYGFDNSILKCIEADTRRRTVEDPADLERVQ